MRRLDSELPGTFAFDPTATFAPTRYELLKVLGSGGFGTVYQAWDRDEAQLVALKLAHESQSWALRRFKAEFRTLADVSHDNLVGLYELHHEGAAWYFTMEYVDGVPFDAWLMPRAESRLPETRAGRPRARNAEAQQRVRSALADADTLSVCSTVAHVADCSARQMHMRGELSVAGSHAHHGVDYPRLRAAFRQVVEALATLHASGHLHRDIKPSNVLVTPEGVVKLVDFGLVTKVKDGGCDALDALAGTAHFMAPELSLGARPTPASDWYSAGVMLYLVLTGTLPYVANADVCSGDGTYAPSAVCDGIPEDLDRICAALLSADPADRPDAATLLAVFTAPSATRRTITSPSLSFPSLTQPRPFIGRRSELRDLLRALRPGEQDASHPRVVLVSGESGVGKSMLITSTLRDSAWIDAPLVLQSRCLERGSLRLRALDGAVDDLSVYLARKSPRELAQLFPLERRDRAALVTLFPVLATSGVFFGEVALGATIASPELEQRGLNALRHVLTKVACERRVVVVIDHAHWADADDLAALRTLLDLDGPAIDWLLVAREGIPRLKALDQVAYLTRVHVGPLPAGDARELAKQLGAGAMSEPVARDTHGNPGLIELVVHAGGVGLGHTIARAIASLDAVSRRALELVAIRPATVKALRAATTITRHDLARLVEARLLQLRPGAGEDEVTLWHPALAHAVAAQSGGNIAAKRACEAA